MEELERLLSSPLRGMKRRNRPDADVEDFEASVLGPHVQKPLLVRRECPDTSRTDGARAARVRDVVSDDGSSGRVELDDTVLESTYPDPTRLIFMESTGREALPDGARIRGERQACHSTRTRIDEPDTSAVRPEPDATGPADEDRVEHIGRQELLGLRMRHGAASRSPSLGRRWRDRWLWPPRFGRPGPRRPGSPGSRRGCHRGRSSRTGRAFGRTEGGPPRSRPRAAPWNPRTAPE